MLFAILAITAAGLFAGAALYINVVEHPARVECGTAAALAEFAPSYRRATRMQASLAAVAFLSGIAAWLRLGHIALLVAAVLIGAVIPFTLIVIAPTNRQLLDPALDRTSPDASALLARWQRLHAVRTVLSLAAFGLLVWCTACGATQGEGPRAATQDTPDWVVEQFYGPRSFPRLRHHITGEYARHYSNEATMGERLPSGVTVTSRQLHRTADRAVFATSIRDARRSEDWHTYLIREASIWTTEWADTDAQGRYSLERDFGGARFTCDGFGITAQAEDDQPRFVQPGAIRCWRRPRRNAGRGDASGQALNRLRRSGAAGRVFCQMRVDHPAHAVGLIRERGRSGERRAECNDCT